tara:strand:- start:47 stop:310 length:264 start_codon:yes stop_codon:yes gene_type:complete
MTLKELINKLQESIDNSVCDADSDVAIEIHTKKDFITCWNVEVGNIKIDESNYVCLGVCDYMPEKFIEESNLVSIDNVIFEPMPKGN